MVGRGGFEPPKALPADLQSAPFGRLGTCPNKLLTLAVSQVTGPQDQRSRRPDLNRQPSAYKADALPN